MAHTERRRTDKRKDGKVFKRGTPVGMMVNGQLSEGEVYSADAGGWVYIHWSRATGSLPGYCRSSQLINLEKQDAA
jgi:hypothetical protein